MESENSQDLKPAEAPNPVPTAAIITSMIRGVKNTSDLIFSPGSSAAGGNQRPACPIEDTGSRNPDGGGHCADRRGPHRA